MKINYFLLTAIFFMAVSKTALADNTLSNCTYVYKKGKMSESTCMTLPVAEGSTDKTLIPTYFKARLGSLSYGAKKDFIVLDALSWKFMSRGHCGILDTPKNRKAVLDFMKDSLTVITEKMAFEAGNQVNGVNCNPLFIYYEKKEG
ncbi:hypothetical protein BSQ98_24785 [Serratia liquefaciens]|uniref:hypothetical protein n=1 Tax=Serratia TaxID=613 RepID=UPI0010206035|nr:hypothetical protein [Serratia liquefaciens]RYM58217.1 hypothetical protein BSQ98_24785 [Serratia liquefaciens]